ncbi:MAG: PQQ-binding-like beta-propeller repeat protein, partial [Caldiserica bacterium]|nr:PQQ-binding-like beta-propeller repeat protein [Caldisericota bacterium]
MKKLGILVAMVIAISFIGIAKIDNTTAGGGWQASHPAIWNNLVIAPITMSGSEGTHKSAVCGINIDSGAVEWKFEAPDRIFSSVSVEGDKAYIVLPHNKYPYRYLTCLNAKTGELIKEVPFEKATYNRPLIKDGLIYVGTTGISAGR